MRWCGLLALKKHGILTSAAVHTGIAYRRSDGHECHTNTQKWRKIEHENLALLLIVIGPMITLPAVAQTPAAAARVRVDHLG